MSKGREVKSLIGQNKHLRPAVERPPLHAKIVEKAGLKFIHVGGHEVSITHATPSGTPRWICNGAPPRPNSSSRSA